MALAIERKSLHCVQSMQFKNYIHQRELAHNPSFMQVPSLLSGRPNLLGNDIQISSNLPLQTYPSAC